MDIQVKDRLNQLIKINLKTNSKFKINKPGNHNQHMRKYSIKVVLVTHHINKMPLMDLEVIKFNHKVVQPLLLLKILVRQHLVMILISQSMFLKMI